MSTADVIPFHHFPYPQETPYLHCGEANGPPQSNDYITLPWAHVHVVKEEGTPYSVEEAKLFEKTSDVKPVSASEPYLGLPTTDKERKEVQLWTFLFEYFPDAFLAVVGVSIAGNRQHNIGKPMHWDRTKSTDQLNTALRHQWDYGRRIKKDTDGQYHLAKAIWRLMAQLQLDIEAERNGAK